MVKQSALARSLSENEALNPVREPTDSEPQMALSLAGYLEAGGILRLASL